MKTNFSRLNLWSLFLILTILIRIAIPMQVANAYAEKPIPVLAYYYIWFDSNSWNRAKMDYPLLGKYTSDDRSVMRQHIKWAKAAGINGFIVSWKSTDTLNKRLSLLVDVATEENFKLGIIYQGLDFDRNPLPVDRIATDLDTFTKDYGGNPVFTIFSKPLVIWSGTWKFSTDQIKSVTSTRRNNLLILASEKNLNGYQRIADYVDGNAYYWSSVNPDTFQGYEAKLSGMSQAIHSNNGIWIAPAAPGFDARLLGGTSFVDRKNGDTLRIQLNIAKKTSPDALGLISWNEFSENSQIEPSQNYKSSSLEVLSEINHLPPPVIPEFDSSEPAGIYKEWFNGTRIVALGGLVVLILSGFLVMIIRQFKP